MTGRREVVMAEIGAPLARFGLPAIVIACYLAIGAVAFWPLFPGMTHSYYGAEADYQQSIWFISWVHYALTHGQNPLFSNALLVPAGTNLAQNTASPLLGLLTVPLAPVMGAIARTNLLMVLAMPVSGAAGFVVLRKWQVWFPAAAIGGLMYGFSPYMVGQATGHIDLIFLPLPPFIASTVVSIVRGNGPPWRLGSQLGLLLAAQYLISPEILTITAVLTAAGLVVLAILRPSELVTAWRRVTTAAVWALFVAGVLVAYPVWLLLAGPQHFTGRTFAADNPYHNDLLSFLVPGPLQRVSLGMRATGVRLADGGDPTEAGGYVGVPVLLIAGYLAWRARRSLRMQLAGLVTLVAAVLSLGPFLAVNGHLTRFPLPFWVFDHARLLDDILPSRINFSVAAGLAAVTAFGLHDLSQTWRTRTWHLPPAVAAPWRSVAATAGVLVVLVATQLPNWPANNPAYKAKPASVLPQLIKDAIPAGDPVAITYPYASFPWIQPMMWQADDGFRFRLVGGYAYRPGVGGAPDPFPALLRPPQLQQFLASAVLLSSHGYPEGIRPDLVEFARQSVEKYDIRLAIVDRSLVGSAQVAALFTRIFGPPRATADDFSVWTRPPR